MHGINIPQQEFVLKMQGALMRKGGGGGGGGGLGWIEGSSAWGCEFTTS